LPICSLLPEHNHSNGSRGDIWPEDRQAPQRQLSVKPISREQQQAMQYINVSHLQQIGEQGNTDNPAMILHWGYNWPLPLTLPDASKGQEAVMQAIDEWFKHQELMELLQSMATYNSLPLASTSITSTANKTATNSTMDLLKRQSNNNTQ